MSNNETQKPRNKKPLSEFSQKELLDLDETLQNRIVFMIHNERDTRVVKVSDSERGSISNELYAKIASIDSVRPALKEILNFRIKVKNEMEFYSKYGEYGKKINELKEILEEVDTLGFDLLSQVFDSSSIRNRRIREKVFPKAPEETKRTTPAKKTVAKKAPAKKTVAKKTTKTPAKKTVRKTASKTGTTAKTATKTVATKTIVEVKEEEKVEA